MLLLVVVVVVMGRAVVMGVVMLVVVVMVVVPYPHLLDVVRGISPPPRRVHTLHASGARDLRRGGGDEWENVCEGEGMWSDGDICAYAYIYHII